MPKKVNVAIIGLGFGAEFIPIYQRHPQANMYAICQRNPEKLKEISKAARKSAQARFCSSKIIPQYEEFYRRVLERSS